MSESYNISGLLLASIEQSLSVLLNSTPNQYEQSDAGDVLREVQGILRGDTDGDQEEVTEPEVEADSGSEGN